ncbi:Inositol-pentakisphosphate 2-kinase [Fusarium austroafricanum]|uniref:Inositol-pentakisphosphate 2-kinase n=1 Tax=Fusarium austroafricanum TaxID=2364996 RepID=A0A8H4P986_9HYPO|nr:Inositol-pentakisphosphate 2-kinase [Fusarium austroafricanum]
MSTPSLSDGQLTPTDTDPDLCFSSSEDDHVWPTPQDVVEMSIMLNGSAVPLSWTRESLKRLPIGSRPIKMVGEGAANVVFELGIPEGNMWANDFNGWLLRVAKAPASGQPARFNYLKQQEFYAKQITPFLKTHAIQQQLVVLRHTNIIPQLNAFLRSIDHLRKEKFRGSFVSESNWGLLVEDMRVSDPKNSILIEFKPKWLNQSPSAPQGAIRCRQCAMELFNYLRDPNPSRHAPEQKPCPLTLANPDAPVAISSPFRFAPKLASKANNPMVRELLAKTADHQVIRDLRWLQKLADSKGPLQAEKNDPMFSLAMTVRDCTCFVQMNLGPDVPPEQRLRVRLGDFDLKDTDIKFKRWTSAETDLIESGCYIADWIMCNGQYYHPPTKCLLEWTRRRDRFVKIIGIKAKDSHHNNNKAVHFPAEAMTKQALVYWMTTHPAKLTGLLEPGRKDKPKNEVCPFRIEPPNLLKWVSKRT